MPPPPAAASNLSWRRADGEPPLLTLDTPARCSTSTTIVRASGGCQTVGAPRARALECNLRAFDVCARAALFTLRSSRVSPVPSPASDAATVTSEPWAGGGGDSFLLPSA
jgi:hypothetical protein